jgi:hypothetical protein
MTFVDEKKYKRVQELGRTKSHEQKKRARESMKLLPEAEREQFVVGCYDELRIQLLRQLYRMLGESEDYEKAKVFLEEKVGEEIKSFKEWLKGA